MSQYVCSITLSLDHSLSIQSEIIPGELNEVTFAVDAFDEKYDHATIDLYNAIDTRKVAIPPLSKNILVIVIYMYYNNHKYMVTV